VEEPLQLHLDIPCPPTIDSARAAARTYSLGIAFMSESFRRLSIMVGLNTTVECANSDASVILNRPNNCENVASISYRAIKLWNRNEDVAVDLDLFRPQLLVGSVHHELGLLCYEICAFLSDRHDDFLPGLL
jgi:hypothetical protein